MSSQTLRTLKPDTARPFGYPRCLCSSMEPASLGFACSVRGVKLGNYGLLLFRAEAHQKSRNQGSKVLGLTVKVSKSKVIRVGGRWFHFPYLVVLKEKYPSMTGVYGKPARIWMRFEAFWRSGIDLGFVVCWFASLAIATKP